MYNFADSGDHNRSHAVITNSCETNERRSPRTQSMNERNSLSRVLVAVWGR